MVLNISAGSLSISQKQAANYNTTVAGSQNQEETTKTSSLAASKLKEAEEGDSGNGSVTETSTQGDTLTLSQAGLKMAQGGTTEDSTSSSSDLSGYSESQLKSMLNNGEITQAEYNKEMQKRATEDTGVTDTTTEQLKNNQKLVSSLDILV